MRLSGLVIVCLLAANHAAAWGEKGHYIVGEAATFGVPTEMPPFFHAAYPSLVYLNYDPDRWRDAGPSLHAFNPPNHFLDWEYVADLELPPSRYAFLDLLHSSGTLRKYGIESTTSGFLPWQIAESAELLTVQWRLWRASTDLHARQQIEQNIIFIAGSMGHWIADASNPHHTTIHYNGWAGPNPLGFRFDCGTHSRFESQFVAHAMTVEDAIPLLDPPQVRKDFFAEALGFVRASNDLVDDLYALDRDGAFDRKTDIGRQFAALRLAQGASWLRDIWWSTWLASADRPPRPRR